MIFTDTSFLFEWVDLMWLPIILLVVKKHQRWVSAGFFLSCALMMRLQVELIASTGYLHGFLNLMSSDIFSRGLATYSLFYLLYCGLMIYSPETRGAILLAGAISIFFAALLVSMVVMVL